MSARTAVLVLAYFLSRLRPFVFFPRLVLLNPKRRTFIPGVPCFLARLLLLRRPLPLRAALVDREMVNS